MTLLIGVKNPEITFKTQKNILRNILDDSFELQECDAPLELVSPKKVARLGSRK